MSVLQTNKSGKESIMHAFTFNYCRCVMYMQLHLYTAVWICCYLLFCKRSTSLHRL